MVRQLFWQLDAYRLTSVRWMRDRGMNERGASAVEYALLIALIAAVIVVAVWALGTFVKGAFDNTCKAVNGVSPAGATCSAPSTATPTS